MCGGVVRCLSLVDVESRLWFDDGRGKEFGPDGGVLEVFLCYGNGDTLHH